MIASRQASTLVLLFVVLISLLVVSSFTTMVHATATPSLDSTTIDLYKVMTPKRKEKIKRNLSENMANREAAFKDWLDGLNKDLEYNRDGYIIGIIVLSVFSGVFLLLAIIFCCLGATTQYSRQQSTVSAALLKSQAEMPQSRPAAPITLQPMLGSESAGNGSARACNPNGSTPKDPELIRPASFAGPPRAILSKSPFPAALPLHMRPHVPRGSPGPVSPNRVVLSGPPHLPHAPSTSPLRVGALPAVGSKAGSPKMSPGVVNLSPTRILSPDQVSVNGKDPMSKASPVAGSPRLPVNLSPTRQGVTGEPKSSGIPKPLSASPPKLPPNLSPKETKEII